MMKKCICNVENEWLETATSLLQKNHISPDHFANCVRLLLEKGRGKYRNIMLTGPANCGKTFLLNPLNIVFKTFTNPASTSFAWVGAETTEVIFLNYFESHSRLLLGMPLVDARGQTGSLTCTQISLCQGYCL